MKARHIVYPLHSDCFWKTEAPLLCRFLGLTCFVPLRGPLGEWRLMWCLRSLKRSAFGISLNWSAPAPSFSPASHTLSLSFLLFFFRDIPRIPDSTHSQLESSEFCQHFFRGFDSVPFDPINHPRNTKWRKCLFGADCVCHPAFLSSPTWQDFCALFAFPFFVCSCYNLQFSPCAAQKLQTANRWVDYLTVSSVPCQVRVLSSLRRWTVLPSLSLLLWVPACWGTPPSTCQDSSQ